MTSLIRPVTTTAPGKVWNRHLNGTCEMMASMKPKKLATAQRNLAKEKEDGLANLAKLITTNGLVIKPADKGSGVVLMHEEDYNNAISSFLKDTNYEIVSDIDSNAIVSKVISFTNKWKNSLTKDELKAVTKTESYVAGIYIWLTKNPQVWIDENRYRTTPTKHLELTSGYNEISRRFEVQANNLMQNMPH